MRCPYCQQNIRVQGRFCPKCGQQIFGLPVRPSSPPTGASPAGPVSAPPPAARQAAPPAYRPFGPPAAPPDLEDLGADSIVIETDEEPVSRPAAAAPATAGVHPAAGDEIGKTCPYCRFPLKPGEQVMTCPACKVPHHADCWSENRGCTTYGCQGSATAAPAAPATPSVLRPSPSPRTTVMPDLDMLQQTELSGRANNAVILAALGLACCFPLALIGLFMSISILGDIARLRVSAPAARGKAIAAIVLTAIALVVWVIVGVVASSQGAH